ncbi:hypothetical protein EDB19DRAFT_1837918 [Suillus lakei]|nr:hypothetical protein EDB19DRAFT_1837918 [Suillus lakei]
MIPFVSSNHSISTILQLRVGILRIWCDLRLAVLGGNDPTEVLMLDDIIIRISNITTGIEIFTMLIFQINGPFLPSEAPLPLLSMDELICLGCGKSFNSQRRLSAHETSSANLTGALRSTPPAGRNGAPSSVVVHDVWLNLGATEKPAEGTRRGKGTAKKKPIPLKMWEIWTLETGIFRMLILLGVQKDPAHIPCQYLRCLPCVLTVLDASFACPDDMMILFLAMT